MKRVVLVSCTKNKLSEPIEAENLYSSVWFSYARKYAESLLSSEKDKWLILSAKYYLVKPSDIISPYERRWLIWNLRKGKFGRSEFLPICRITSRKKIMWYFLPESFTGSIWKNDWLLKVCGFLFQCVVWGLVSSFDSWSLWIEIYWVSIKSGWTFGNNTHICWFIRTKPT